MELVLPAEVGGMGLSRSLWKELCPDGAAGLAEEEKAPARHVLVARKTSLQGTIPLSRAACVVLQLKVSS